MLVVLSLLTMLISNLAYSSDVECVGGSAVVVNGAAANNDDCSYYQDMDDIYKSLGRLKCKSSMGPEATNISNCSSNSLTFSGGKKTDNFTSKEAIKKKILERARMLNGEPLVIYFTDHGGLKQNESSVSVGKDSLLASELKAILVEAKKAAGPNSKIIYVGDHCHSGGMLEPILGKNGKLEISGACGIASSRKEDISFSGLTLASSIVDIETLKERRGIADIVFNANNIRVEDMWAPQLPLAHLSDEMARSAVSWYSKIKSHENIKEKKGSVSFYQASQIYGLDHNVSSIPVLTSELYLEQYYSENRAKDLPKLTGGQCSCDELDQISNCHKFGNILGPIFEGSLKEANQSWALAKFMISHDQRDISIVEREKKMKDLEKKTEVLSAKVSQLNSQEEAAFLKSWPGREEMERLLKIANSGNVKGLSEEERIKIHQDYRKLIEQYQKEWERRHQLPEVHSISQKLNAANIAIIEVSQELSAHKRILVTAKHSEALKIMAQKSDTKSLENYLSLLECEKTIVGDAQI